MSAPPPPPRGLAPLLALVTAAARLVPARRRADWTREWRAELWHRWCALEDAGRLDGPAVLDLLLRALGAVIDAAHLRATSLESTLPAALRSLAANPGQSTAAALVLSLAIGMDTLAFALAGGLGTTLPPGAGIIALIIGVALVGAAARAAGGLAFPGPIPRETTLFPTLRETAVLRALVVAIVGTTAGVLLALLGWARTSTDALPMASFLAASAVSLLTGALLVRRAASRPG